MYFVRVGFDRTTGSLSECNAFARALGRSSAESADEFFEMTEVTLSKSRARV